MPLPSPTALSAPVPGAPRERRVASLDGLRGIAVLLVLAIHFAQTAQRPDHAINLVLHGVMKAGWTGVDLFFVLSGFLITGILYDAKGGARFFRNFYMRRVLRIFPLYYFSLLVLVVVLPALLPPSAALEHMRTESPWYWSYLANLRIASRGWSEHTYIGHFWTLAVEEQFYLVWPLLVFALSRTALMRVCAGIVVAALLLRIALHAAGEGTAAYVLTPTRFDSLAMGAFLALLQRSPNGLGAWRRELKLTAAAAAVVLVGLAVHYRQFPPEALLIGTIGYTALGAFFAGLVGLAVSTEARQRPNPILGSPQLAFFGKYSYALYVVHPAIIFFWPAALSAPALEVAAFGLWPVALAISSLLMLAACVVVSVASWHLLEKHFLKLRFHFADERPRRLLGETPRAETVGTSAVPLVS